MSGYPESIQGELDSLDAFRMAVLGMVDVAREAEEVASMFLGLAPSVDVEWFGGVALLFDVKDVKDVVPLLRELARRGYRQTESAHEFSETRRVVWTCGAIEVKASFPIEGADGAVCRYVQTGTHTREVPVYELRCNGTSGQEALALTAAA